MLAIAMLRVGYHDGTNTLTCLNAFTRYLYLPAYLFLAFAIWKRRQWLGWVNLAIVGCHVLWLAPDFLRDRRFDATSTIAAREAASARRVRILFANAQYLNPEFSSFLREVNECDPDVIVIVEFPWAWREPFSGSPLIAKYRFGHGYKPWRYSAVVVYSKVPLRSETETIVANRFVETLVLDVDGQPLHVIGLHAPRPMNRRDNDYAGFWRQAIPLIAAAPHPLVVVGDFNATQYSRVYGELKAGGLRSAHEDRGRGYATSWPNGRLPIPPIRIDQAFLSGEVACRDIFEGRGNGSDHKPLILDVQIPAVP